MKRSAHFQVDPRLASLLGETYHSSERALKELVDNAWDAEAENVEITLPAPMTADPIVVKDDGAGMTEQELKHEYLRVASDRRSRKGDRTPAKNRLVKGRKGIGKFAGLMAANYMEVQTRARGRMCRMTLPKKELLEAGGDLEGFELEVVSESCEQSEHGTTIILTSLNQQLAFPNPEKLKELLVLEYGRETDFWIQVNGETVGIEDVPGRGFEHEIEIPDIGRALLRFKVAEGGRSPKQPGIVLKVAGKVVGKPQYFGLEDSEIIPKKLLSKVYGEVEADCLADFVTADWAAVIENSNAFASLKPLVHKHLEEGVEIVHKTEVNLAKARLQKKINSALDRLPEHRRTHAHLALQRVLEKFYYESEDKIEVIISVVLEALERDEYWLVMQKIDEAKGQDIMILAEALNSFGLADLALIGQQAQRRLRFLDELEVLARNEETLESTIHLALEKNLWVLEPSAPLLASNKTLAMTIENYCNKEFSGPRAKNRPDLLFGKDARGHHLLIELKRPSHIITRDDETQAIKYRDDLLSTFGKIDILILGKQRGPQLSALNERESTKLLSYLDVISTARQQLSWLIEELKKDARS